MWSALVYMVVLRSRRVCGRGLCNCPGLRLSFQRLARLPWSSVFPYTTLFRSIRHPDGVFFWRRRIPIMQKLLLFVDKDRKSTRLNSSHRCNSYAVFCLKKKKGHETNDRRQFKYEK